MQVIGGELGATMRQKYVSPKEECGKQVSKSYFHIDFHDYQKGILKGHIERLLKYQ